MRDKLAQIRKVREIRADARMREWSAARQELLNIEQRIEDMRRQKVQLEQDAANRLHQFSAGGGRMTGPEISALKLTIESLRQSTAQIIRDIGKTELERDKARETVRVRQIAMQQARRSVDQFTMLDEKLAEEEAKLAERAEEAENETVPRLRKPARDS